MCTFLILLRPKVHICVPTNFIVLTKTQAPFGLVLKIDPMYTYICVQTICLNENPSTLWYCTED
ncbi:hypothetical protein WDU94_002759 [Cyamophila willieti]